MILPGEYAWRGNNRYGDNHRFLRLIAGGRDAEAITRFELSVVHSAGFMGKDWSVLSGTVRVLGPGRLELVADKNERFTVSDDHWSQDRPSSERKVFVEVKRRAPLGQRVFELDGERYVLVPERR